MHLLLWLPVLPAGVFGFVHQPQATSTTSLAAKKKVFIDGEAGTTGLQVQSRLSTHPDIELVPQPPAESRKDPAVRAELINSADAVVLCLPDDAAREAVSLANDDVRIVDASTAHRVSPGWEYGFAEMCEGQRERIEKSTRVANPGCYATGFVSIARPLVDAGVLDPSAKLACSAISGYTGGGKALVSVFEGGAEPWGAYGFNLDHKHLPEMAAHSKLETPPVFLPAVGDFAQGMVVSVMLHYDKNIQGGEAVYDALHQRYEHSEFVEVMPYGLEGAKDAGLLERDNFLEPTKLNGSNNLQLFVFANDRAKTAVVSARLDNLGKGASGAAVQNLNIMLGLDEHLGLNL